MPDLYGLWYATIRIWWSLFFEPIRDREAESLRACLDVQRKRTDKHEVAMIRHGIV